MVADCGPGSGYQTPDLVQVSAGPPVACWRAGQLLTAPPSPCLPLPPQWMQQNASLSGATAVVGLHYPNSILPANLNKEFYSNLTNLPGRQKLWASEEFSTMADGNAQRPSGLAQCQPPRGSGELALRLRPLSRPQSPARNAWPSSSIGTSLTANIQPGAAAAILPRPSP